MTSMAPILLACFVHLALHTTLFVQIDPEIYANTPILGSQLFYLSVLDLLYQCQLIPKHWNYLPTWARPILETIAVFFISEVSMAVVWLTMETYLRELIAGVATASGLEGATSYCSQRLVLEVSTVALSVVFTVVVTAFTNRTVKRERNGAARINI